MFAAADESRCFVNTAERGPTLSLSLLSAFFFYVWLKVTKAIDGF